MTYAEALAAYRESDRKEQGNYKAWRQSMDDLEQARQEAVQEKALLDSKQETIDKLNRDSQAARENSDQFRQNTQIFIEEYNKQAGELTIVKDWQSGEKPIFKSLDEMADMKLNHPEEYQKLQEELQWSVHVNQKEISNADSFMQRLDEYMELSEQRKREQEIQSLPNDLTNLYDEQKKDKTTYDRHRELINELLEAAYDEKNPNSVRSLEEYEKSGGPLVGRKQDKETREKKHYIKDTVVGEEKKESKNRLKDLETKVTESKKLLESGISQINTIHTRTNNLMKDTLESLKNDLDPETHEQHVNQVMTLALKEEKNQADRNYRSAALKKFMVDKEQEVVGPLARGYRNLVLTATEAVIRGKLAEKQKKLDTATKELRDIREAQVGANQQTNAAYRKQENTSRVDTGQEHANRVAEGTEHANRFTELLGKKQREVNELQEEYRLTKDQVDREILENRARFHEMFEKRYKAIDLKSQSEQLQQWQQERLETARNANNIKEEQRLRAQYERESNKLQEIADSKEYDMQQMQVAMVKAGKRSEALSVLFTQDSLSTIDSVVAAVEKLVDAGTKIYNYIQGNDSDSDKDKDKEEDKPWAQRLKKIKEELEKKEEKSDEHILTELVGIADVVMNKVNTFVDELNQKSEQTYDNYQVAVGKVQRIEIENELIGTYLENHPDDRKLNMLDQRRKYYEDQVEQTEARTAREIESNNQTIANIRKKSIEADGELAFRETKEAEKRQAVNAERIHRAELAEGLKQAFAQTVKDAQEPAKPMTLTREDIFRAKEGEKDAPDFTFLSRLTGTQMSADMKLDDAMDAFGKIYINGLNAIDYFDLRDTYEKTAAGKEEEQKSLISRLAGLGEDMKAALQVPFDPSKAGSLTGEAARLAGQMIAVEDDHLQLSAVQLDAQDTPPEKPVLVQKEHVKGWFKSGVNEQIDQENAAARQQYETRMAVYNQYMADHAGIDAYNRNSKMITDEFQKMRQIAAETTLKQAQPEIAAGTATATQGATKVTFDALMQEERRNQNLTKAVHHSRNLGLADAEKTVLAEDKTQQKEEPKQEEPKKKEPVKEGGMSK
jgi:hypothetical protein